MGLWDSDWSGEAPLHPQEESTTLPCWPRSLLHALLLLGRDLVHTQVGCPQAWALSLSPTMLVLGGPGDPEAVASKEEQGQDRPWEQHPENHS